MTMALTWWPIGVRKLAAVPKAMVMSSANRVQPQRRGQREAIGVKEDGDGLGENELGKQVGKQIEQREENYRVGVARHGQQQVDGGLGQPRGLHGAAHGNGRNQQQQRAASEAQRLVGARTTGC